MLLTFQVVIFMPQVGSARDAPLASHVIARARQRKAKAAAKGRFRGGSPSDSLLGADIAIVGSRLGPPLHCKVERGEVHLAYAGPGGCTVPDGAVEHDPALQELTFAAWRVFVHEGRVVLAQPRTVTRAS